MCVFVFVSRMTRRKVRSVLLRKEENKESLKVSVMMRTEEEDGSQTLRSVSFYFALPGPFAFLNNLNLRGLEKQSE